MIDSMLEIERESFPFTAPLGRQFAFSAAANNGRTRSTSLGHSQNQPTHETIIFHIALSQMSTVN